MKTMRVIVFALLSSIPGTLLAELIYWLIGEPEVWDQTQYLTCYGPIFGFIALGAWYGIKVNRDEELEA